jgi:LacI family transcriptional regulator
LKNTYKEVGKYLNVTIHDVAEKAKVSISTVSRVVNNPESVRKDKRERVLKVIQELEYHPNPFAAGLRDNRTMTIAAIISDISNPFYSALFRGIEDAARERKNNVIICNIGQSEERFIEYMSYFKKKKIDGLVFTSAELSPTFNETLKSLNKPVVLAATKSAEFDFPFVKIDDYKASYDAAMFLIKNGHSEVGLISGNLDDPIAGMPRYEGFLQAFKDENIPISDKNIVFGNLLDFNSGYEAMGRLYAKLPNLTAVFAASDLLALGVMSFLQSREIKVPKHVSVIGFDNIEFSRMVTPPLTTVAQPIYDIGKEATKILFQMIDGATTESKPSFYLPHEIIVRNSVYNRK